MDTRNCKRLTLLWPLPRIICSYISWIHRRFVVVSLLWTKHGCSTTCLRPNNIPIKSCQRRVCIKKRGGPLLQIRIVTATMFWFKEVSSFLFWNRVKLLQAPVLHPHWTSWKSSCNKKGLVDKKEFFHHDNPHEHSSTIVIAKLMM